MLVVENGYIDNNDVAKVPYYVNVLNPLDLYPIVSAPEPYMNNLTFNVRVGNVVGGRSQSQFPYFGVMACSFLLSRHAQ